MEKATNALRRSGAYLLTYGAPHQELNIIISDLKSLKSQLKVVRDSQQTIIQGIWNWTSNKECTPLKEVFAHLSELNELWTEVQTEFTDQIADFKRQFEMILEGERYLDAAKNELSNCDIAEQKAEKKLKKVEKKNAIEDIKAAQLKVEECKSQKELIQYEVSEKISENEAVKLIRLKDGLLKLSEAYLTLSHKCIYVFEAQKEIVKALPDVEEKAIHEMKYEGLPGAEDTVRKARALVEEYGASKQSSQTRSPDPPPPYSVNSLYVTPPFNPYYLNPDNGVESSGSPRPEGDGPNSLYPSLGCNVKLVDAMNAAKI